MNQFLSSSSQIKFLPTNNINVVKQSLHARWMAGPPTEGVGAETRVLSAGGGLSPARPGKVPCVLDDGADSIKVETITAHTHTHREKMKKKTRQPLTKRHRVKLCQTG